MARNESWRHHFAPQFYLRHWTTPPDDRLWRYYRPHVSRFVEERVAPVSTGYKRHLYRTPPATPFDTWASDVVETDALAPLDNAAAVVHRRLLARERLNDDDRRTWARFLSSLMERHPKELAERDEKALQIVEQLRAQYAERWKGKRAERALALLDMGTAATNLVRTHMWKEINDSAFLDYLTNEHSWFVAGPAETEYITSERPLVVNAGETSSRPVHMLTLPLSPRDLFVSVPRSWTSDPAHDHNLAIVLALHNLFLVQAGPACVYSASQIVDVEGASLRLRRLIESTLEVSAPV